MKYTIEGFNQRYAMTLRKEVEVKGKKVIRKIDCTDLVILRWFVDFYPNMKKVNVNGKECAWVYYQKIMDDLPLIDISRRAFADRLQKMVDFGLLTFEVVYEMEGVAGTYTTYGFGSNYINLVNDYAEGCGLNDKGGCSSNDNPHEGQSTNKDNSINNTSFKEINNNKINNDKANAEPLPLVEPNIFIKELIKCGYIEQDELFLDQFNYFMQEIADQYGFEIARTCLMYFVSRCNGFDENGNPIMNKFNYFKTSIEFGVTRLTANPYEPEHLSEFQKKIARSWGYDVPEEQTCDNASYLLAR